MTTPRDEIAEKAAYWRTEVVNARLRSTFEPADVPRAAVVLAALAPAPDCGPEADETACRLMLAALRVSEGNLHKLAMWVEVARADPRDLIAAAEYRLELGSAPDSELIDDVRAMDLDAYLDWVSGRD